MFRFEIPDDFRIPADHDAKLRSCIGLTTKPGEKPVPLPDALVQAYYGMRRCLDILGCGFPDQMLAVVVNLAILSGSWPTPQSDDAVSADEDETAEIPAAAEVGIPPPSPKSFRELVAEKAIKPGDLVKAMFGGALRPGYFLTLSGDKNARVVIDGKDRVIATENLRQALSTDFPDLRCRNIND